MLLPSNVFVRTESVAIRKNGQRANVRSATAVAARTAGTNDCGRRVFRNVIIIIIMIMIIVLRGTTESSSGGRGGRTTVTEPPRARALTRTPHVIRRRAREPPTTRRRRSRRTGEQIAVGRRLVRVRFCIIIFKKSFYFLFSFCSLPLVFSPYPRARPLFHRFPVYVARASARARARHRAAAVYAGPTETRSPAHAHLLPGHPRVRRRRHRDLLHTVRLQ